MSENMKKSPSKTAEEVTLIRISESQKEEDERICYDPLAIHFISLETLELLGNNPEINKEKDVIFRGVANSIAARVRYFDEFVEKCIIEGLEQLVILGAGYDTRAYRLEGIKENVKVFEIDHPSTQRVKLKNSKKSLDLFRFMLNMYQLILKIKILVRNSLKVDMMLQKRLCF